LAGFEICINSITMIQLNQHTPVRDLESIREGDRIVLRNGKSDEVVKIQVVCNKGQKQYFYKLRHDGTVFIAK